MKRFVYMLPLVAALVLPAALHAETPEASVIVDKMIAALDNGGFSDLGVLRLEVVEEQTRNDGVASTKEFTAYVDSSSFDNLRMEMGKGVVIAKQGASGWAMDKGVVDDRPQTPFMVEGTLNQSIFPILLPYTLKMDGVWGKEVVETTWEGKDAWLLLVPFTKGFFVSPVLTTTWRVLVDKTDYSILAVDFLPPADMRNVQPMGIRYRVLKYDDVEGVKIPSWTLSVGMNLKGQESGATRVTKISTTVYGPWEAGLFVNPVRLEALEGE